MLSTFLIRRLDLTIITISTKFGADIFYCSCVGDQRCTFHIYNVIHFSYFDFGFLVLKPAFVVFSPSHTYHLKKAAKLRLAY